MRETRQDLKLEIRFAFGLQADKFAIADLTIREEVDADTIRSPCPEYKK
jgi:hypothetical protein